MGRAGFVLIGILGALLIGDKTSPGFAASDFPSKPVTLIVPWAPGGSTDLCLRALAESTGKHLSQPVVVENKPGGSGTVGPATMAATAKPDGYTVSQVSLTVFRLPYLIKATWDPLKDFTYIIHLTGYTYGIVVKKDSPWKTFKEFIEYAKANPGKVSYATPGVGTIQHITMERIAQKENIRWVHVPCKGGAEVITSVLGGHVMAGAETSTWAPQVNSGDLRLLVLWTSERSKKWPDVPTLKELGYGIVSVSPFGIAGPKGMDPKVVKVLHDAFKKAMEEPAFRKVLDDLDMVPYYLDSADYANLVEKLISEEKENAEIVKAKKE